MLDLAPKAILGFGWGVLVLNLQPSTLKSPTSLLLPVDAGTTQLLH